MRPDFIALCPGRQKLLDIGALSDLVIFERGEYSGWRIAPFTVQAIGYQTARAIGVSGSERTLVDGSGLGMRSPCEKSRADVVDRWRWWRTREIEPGEAPR